MYDCVAIIIIFLYKPLLLLLEDESWSVSSNRNNIDDDTKNFDRISQLNN